METQLQATKVKLQEKTPAFTTLKSATVPIRPAGPKRMLFVLGMMVLASMATAFYVMRNNPQ
jgi:LPS O-antigen subunit length determinant protein (WzzB/FepE family)